MRVLAATLIVACSFAGVAAAAINISNFSLSSTTVSFTISGNLPPSVPVTDFQAIYFLNSVPANPGFVIPASFEAPISYSETLAQNLDSDYPVFTGNSTWDGGNFFHVPRDCSRGRFFLRWKDRQDAHLPTLRRSGRVLADSMALIAPSTASILV